MHVVSQRELPLSSIAHAFVGDDHGPVGVSLFMVEAPPGRGPGLHTHPYEEVFLVQEGEATFIAGDEEREVHAGEIVVVPADTPHRFLNTGQAALVLISIHVSSRFVTEWLEASQPPDSDAE
jgi:quercetin dioxygenase-like cupin family protein